MDTQLTKNITLAAMISVGRHKGIKNDPPVSLAMNILRTAQKVEEAFAIVSAVVGFEILPSISYGYRCAELNKAVGGSPTSAHAEGSGADMLVPDKVGLRKFWDILRHHPTFMADVDQLIIERGCVHLGLPVKAHNYVPRHELRTDETVDGVRRYPLFGIWEAPHA